eukprot:scaffold730_cov365-Pinguiococcus_pyrenoidosus.AAC.7
MIQRARDKLFNVQSCGRFIPCEAARKFAGLLSKPLSTGRRNISLAEHVSFILHGHQKRRSHSQDTYERVHPLPAQDTRRFRLRDGSSNPPAGSRYPGAASDTHHIKRLGSANTREGGRKRKGTATLLCTSHAGGHGSFAHKQIRVRHLQQKRKAQRHQNVLDEGVLVAERAKHIPQTVQDIISVLAAGSGWISKALVVTAEVALFRENPREGLEGPHHVLAGNEEAGEDEAREPHLHKLHHPDQGTLALDAEHLRQRLPRIQIRGIEKDHDAELRTIVVRHAVRGNAQGEEREEEHHPQLFYFDSSLTRPAWRPHSPGW